jgi:proteasome accessory factor C
LEGWCHRAQDVRLFRLDRIEELSILEADGTPPEGTRPRATDSGAFRASPGDILVELELTPAAAWVAEHFPVESAQRREDGSQLVQLRAADTAWVRRLVWRLGGQARVISPPELAAEIGSGADQALQAYRVHS